MEIQLNYDLLSDRLFGLNRLDATGKRYFVENVIFDRKHGIQLDNRYQTFEYKFESLEDAEPYLSRLFFGGTNEGILIEVTGSYNGPKMSSIYEAVRGLQFNVLTTGFNTYLLVKRRHSQRLTNALIKAKLEHEPN